MVRRLLTCSRLDALWYLSCRLTRTDLHDHRLTLGNVRLGPGRRPVGYWQTIQASITSPTTRHTGALQPSGETSNRHTSPLYPISKVWAPRFSRLPPLDCRKYPKPPTRHPADTHNARPIYIRRAAGNLECARSIRQAQKHAAAASDQARYCGLILGGYFRGSSWQVLPTNDPPLRAGWGDARCGRLG